VQHNLDHIEIVTNSIERAGRFSWQCFLLRGYTAL